MSTPPTTPAYTRYIPIQIVFNGLAWLPVFSLYFLSRVSLGDALTLGAIYYLAIVLAEVPSGYFSDRLGRRSVLLLAGALAVVANGSFIMAESFTTLAIAQILLGLSIAFQSGSDNALLYDSLLEAGLESEYMDREARGHQWGMISLAVSCLAGGLLGTIDLRLPFVWSLLAGLLSLAIIWGVREPRQHDSAAPLSEQAGTLLRLARHPVLLGMLLFYILGYGLQHLPYEFSQPWLTLALPDGLSEGTALISGLMFALSMSGGAIGARLAPALARRWGLMRLLISSAAAQLLIITLMALFIHPLVILVLLFRNFSMSMIHSPMLSRINPLLSSAQRASWLSVQSLAGRLGFSVTLLLLSAGFGGHELILEDTRLRALLLTAAATGAVLLAVWWVWARRITLDRMDAR